MAYVSAVLRKTMVTTFSGLLIVAAFASPARASLLIMYGPAEHQWNVGSEVVGPDDILIVNLRDVNLRFCFYDLDDCPTWRSTTEPNPGELFCSTCLPPDGSEHIPRDPCSIAGLRVCTFACDLPGESPESILVWEQNESGTEIDDSGCKVPAIGTCGPLALAALLAVVAIWRIRKRRSGLAS